MEASAGAGRHLIGTIAYQSQGPSARRHLFILISRLPATAGPTHHSEQLYLLSRVGLWGASGKVWEVTAQFRDYPTGATNQVMCAICPFFLTNIGWLMTHFGVNSSNDFGIIEYLGKNLKTGQTFYT